MLENANVYPSHRILFKGYLQNQLPERKDEIVLDELQYEFTQMCKSICKILKTISKNTPIIIAMADLQFADCNTLELIKYINSFSASGKIMLLLL